LPIFQLTAVQVPTFLILKEKVKFKHSAHIHTEGKENREKGAHIYLDLKNIQMMMKDNA